MNKKTYPIVIKMETKEIMIGSALLTLTPLDICIFSNELDKAIVSLEKVSIIHKKGDVLGTVNIK